MISKIYTVAENKCKKKKKVPLVFYFTALPKCLCKSKSASTD